jgi:hypothetical protein
MKGDFTRSTFNKKNHYSSVCMQQGRVQMDADWNEQMDIQAHLRQTKARDVIGLTGVPKYGGGFAISIDNNEMKISSGRIYVDGILCELEEDITYQTQPDYPKLPIESDLLVNIADGKYLVYLDVWQRHISALEDENIREKALDGPDTATRSKTVWQVKLQSVDASECSLVDPGWQQGATHSTGLLSARAKPGDESDNPCVLPLNAGYRRIENQLYRVEMHESGIEGFDHPTFKWSRDNGSIVAKVEEISGEEITVSHTVQGRLDEFSPGQWIELTDDGHELRGKKGVFLKIKEKNGEKIKVEPSLEDVGWNPGDFSGLIKIRRWDSKGAVKVEIPSGNDGFLKLEDGVEIKFEQGKEYKTGDYWLIPARSATADIEWPKDAANNPESKTPDGIKHHYGKLALVEIKDHHFNTFIQDCREFFPPLNEVTIGKGCCTLTVGDGQSTYGDVNSLEEAIAQVQTGGTICLLPGLHKANVIIKRGKNISIKGCGQQTRVIPKKSKQPIFHIVDSQFITMEGMNITTFEGTAILMEEKAAGKLKEIDIFDNRMIALTNAVHIRNGERIRIRKNRIRMLDRDEGDTAIFMRAEDSIIENNEISVFPAEKLSSPEEIPHIEMAVPDLSASDTDVESIYNNPFWLFSYMNKIWNDTLSEYPEKAFRVPGGIQIAGDSEGIEIKENQVSGGYWNGITLGHTPRDMDNLLKPILKTNYGINKDSLGDEALKQLKEAFLGFVTNIRIEGNKIKYMGLNGIGVVNFFSLQEVGEMVTVDELTITGNTIVECLQQKPSKIEGKMQMEMAFGGIALADCENLTIRENRIEKNGAHFTAPVCGIFIQHGERIDISNNRILNNGPETFEGLTEVSSGIGGGIIIRLGLGKVIEEFVEKIPFMDGVPAVKIHDNIVTQPLGKALFIGAFGPVSVVGNHLTSQGIDPKISFFPSLAGSVMIINLGVSRDLFAFLLISQLKTIMSSVKEKKKKSLSRENTIGGAMMSMSAANPVYASTSGPLSYGTFASVPANLFCLGMGGMPISPTETHVGDFESAVTAKTGPIIEMLVYLPTGNVLFADNRTTLDLRSQEQDFAISSQLIFSLDDISYVGNQSECNSRIDYVLTDVFTIGNTIRTNDNRFQEGLTIALFSLLSIGFMMNTWTGNQATHCLTAVGIRDEAFDNNLVLLDGIMGFPISDQINCANFRKLLMTLLNQEKINS